MNIAGCEADAAQTLRASFASSVASPSYATQTRYERAEVLFNQVQQSACQAS